MIEQIEIMLMIAEAETNDVALIAREPREKFQRVAPPRVERRAGLRRGQRARLCRFHGLRESRSKPITSENLRQSQFRLQTNRPLAGRLPRPAVEIPAAKSRSRD